MISAVEIDALASRPGVRRLAVENFLSTLDHPGARLGDALANLVADAQAYRWDAATVEAIRDGIHRHFQR